MSSLFLFYKVEVLNYAIGGGAAFWTAVSSQVTNLLTGFQIGIHHYF